MKRFFLSGAVALAGLMWGCYPTGPQYVDEYDLVYSSYDKDYAFKGAGTYSMPDKIPIIDGKLDTAKQKYIIEPYNSLILNQIDTDMKALGWTKVADPATAQVQILPASWNTTTIYYYGGYWCWYYYYYCGGGWYYPYPITSSYTTGTLVILMNDTNKMSPDGSSRVVWTGAVNGLLTGTWDGTRATNSVHQAFIQSPYLKQ